MLNFTVTKAREQIAPQEDPQETAKKIYARLVCQHHVLWKQALNKIYNAGLLSCYNLSFLGGEGVDKASK